MEMEKKNQRLKVKALGWQFRALFALGFKKWDWSLSFELLVKVNLCDQEIVKDQLGTINQGSLYPIDTMSIHLMIFCVTDVLPTMVYLMSVRQTDGHFAHYDSSPYHLLLT